MSIVYSLTSHETVEVVSATSDALEVEVTYSSGGKRPPAHFHAAQDEVFEVRTGRIWSKVEGSERILEPGDVLEIPRGAVHQLAHAGGEPATALWRTSPAGRTLEWFQALDRAGSPGVRGFARLLTEYDDVFRLAARPRPVVDLALRGLARAG